jgi:hypothetical protein
MKDHNTLLEQMRLKCGDELRALGEHGLADGTERIHAEQFIQAANQFHQDQQAKKKAVLVKNRKRALQKKARKANRK